MIRSLRKEGVSKGKIIYFEDQGMASFLLKERGFSGLSLTATDLNRFLFQQLIAQIKYGQDFQANFYSYRLKAGLIMDFVLEIDDRIFAYSVSAGSNASADQIKFAEVFIKKHPQAEVFILHLGESVRKIHPQIIETPLLAVI